MVAARIDLCRHARAGRLVLPVAGRSPSRRITAARGRARCASEPPAGRTLEELGSLSVHVVRGRNDPWHRQWVDFLDAHHNLGPGPLCGAQVRYVVCAHGRVVAAASFSSAALQVAARDRSIGWSVNARQRNRALVIAQSRFCVVRNVPNLASHIHGLLLHRVATDWLGLYGRRPVLVESYVDTARFRGVSYRAANWAFVGHTSGRGRQDARRRAAVSVKSIWLYPLDPKWREILCVEPVLPIDPDLDWAEAEWGGVDLGDRRLTARLVALGRARFARPTASLPQTCGSRAATKAAYRLLNHPNAQVDRLLSEHREQTIRRAAEHSVVLAIQDTTSLNYTRHPATTGLGPIASVGGADAALGLKVHSLLLANLSGTPLGLLDMQVWARDPATFGRSKERDRRSTKEKESDRWLRGYAAADAAANRLERTQVVVVGDREADMYELLRAATSGRAEVLVRACHPRRVLTEEGACEGKLWDLVREEPIAGDFLVHVPRSGARPARTARLELHFREVLLARSKRCKSGPRSIRVFAIAAIETETSAGPYEPIEWLLLTTLRVDTAEAAVEKVGWYAQRWLIEVFHRTLKSGCRIEHRQSTTASSLEAALAIDAVVAWRVMALTKLGREIPDVPCDVFFDELEWKALCCFVHKTPNPPTTPPRLREAVRMVAELGGFLARKEDGEPGAQTIWRGLERLSDISATARIFFSSA